MFHGQNKKYKSKFKKLYIGFAKDPKIKRTAPDIRRSRTVSPDEQIVTIKRYLGVKDLKQLDSEWHDYIRQLKATGYRGKMRAGQFALWANMPIKAERLLKESLQAGNTVPLCYYYLGQAQYRKDKYEEAAESFSKLIEADPLNGMGYIHLAKCKKKLDEEEDVVTRLRLLGRDVDPHNMSVIMETQDDADAETLREREGGK